MTPASRFPCPDKPLANSRFSFRADKSAGALQRLKRTPRRPPQDRRRNLRQRLHDEEVAEGAALHDAEGEVDVDACVGRESAGYRHRERRVVAAAVHLSGRRLKRHRLRGDLAGHGRGRARGGTRRGVLNAREGDRR